MSLKVETVAFTDVVEDVELFEEKACELPKHEWLKEFHDDGPGLWLSTLICPAGCGKSVQAIVCQKQKDTIETIVMPSSMMKCRGCGYEYKTFGEGFTHVWIGSSK